MALPAVAMPWSTRRRDGRGPVEGGTNSAAESVRVDVKVDWELCVEAPTASFREDRR